jgi:hypothetical protein
MYFVCTQCVLSTHINLSGTNVLPNRVFNVCTYQLQAGADGLCPLHPPTLVLRGNPRRVQHHPGGLLVLARGAPLRYLGEIGQEGQGWNIGSYGVLLLHDQVSLLLCSWQVRVC